VLGYMGWNVSIHYDPQRHEVQCTLHFHEVYIGGHEVYIGLTKSIYCGCVLLNEQFPNIYMVIPKYTWGTRSIHRFEPDISTKYTLGDIKYTLVVIKVYIVDVRCLMHLVAMYTLRIRSIPRDK
jgi:hypothetical protein